MSDKEVPELIETRLISGRGIIKIPPSNKYRLLWLYVNVVRLPVINFSSSKTNPDKSEYARITWNRNDYTVREDVLNYEHQVFTWENDAAGYIAVVIPCILENVYTYFDYLAVLGSGAPLPRGDKVWIEPKKQTPDVCKIVCRLNTAVEVQLWRYYYDLNCASATPEPPPPPDPVPPPKSDPNTPLGEISPPYSQPDDGGDTVPYPNDESPDPNPPTDGNPCTKYRFTFIADYYSTETDYQTIEQVLEVWGETSLPYIVPSPPGLNPIQQVAFYCRGLVIFGECQDELSVQVVTNFNTAGGIQNLIVASVEEVP